MSNPVFDALVNLAAANRERAAGLPAQIDAAPRWSGIGFSCLGYRFVVPMGQVSELLEVPSTTRLPGVQPWVLGLSNVRGRLLPLLDLARFVGGQVSNQKKNHRVLVIEAEDSYSGLVVDRAFGMQHFIADTFERFDGELPAELKQFVKGAYRDGNGKPWCVFDLGELTQSPSYMNAAAS